MKVCSFGPDLVFVSLDANISNLSSEPILFLNVLNFDPPLSVFIESPYPNCIVCIVFKVVAPLFSLLDLA